MKKLLYCLLFVLLATLIYAQSTITIGGGVSGHGNYPLNDSSVHSRSQFIYLESEIGSPGFIHELRWYRNGTGADPNAIGTTQIWLKTIANYDVSSNLWEAPGTLVATIDNINLGSGDAWYTVDITDFQYTGGHLLVSVRTQNATISTPHAFWDYANTSYPSGRCGESSSTNPPDMQIQYFRPLLQLYMTPNTPTLVPWSTNYISPLNGSWALGNDLLKWKQGVGFPTSYDIYFGITPDPPYYYNTTALSYAPLIGANMTYYWKIVPRNAIGPATGCPVWSFTTPSLMQLSESFETAVPPLDWANCGTSSFIRSTNSYYHGYYSAYKASSSASVYLLSTPRVTISGASHTLDFWSRSAAVGQYLQIVYSTDRLSWAQFGSDISHPVANTWQHSVIDLSTLSGNYYLGFRSPIQTTSGSMYIDSVVGPLFALTAPGPVVQTAPANLATGVIELPVLSWNAPSTGNAPTGYRIYCDTNAAPTTLIGTTAELSFTPSTALNNNSLYYWKVVAYNSQGDSSGNTTSSFTTRTLASLPYSQNFNSGLSLPAINWTGSMTIAANHGSSGSNGLCAHVYSSIPVSTAGAYPVGPLPTASELRFDYRMVNWSGYPNVAAQILPGDEILVQLSTNGGVSYSTIHTIGYDNHTNSNSFATKAISLTSHAGQSVWIKFVCNWGGGASDYFVDIDNFLIQATATASPTATISYSAGHPLISWAAVSGADRYKVYGSNDPYQTLPWTLITTTTSTSYSYLGTDTFRFFRVTAIVD